MHRLLPAFWRGILPEEKKQAVGVLAKHGGEWTVACVMELPTSMHVPMTDIQNLRVCVEL